MRQILVLAALRAAVGLIDFVLWLAGEHEPATGQTTFRGRPVRMVVFTFE